MPTISDLHHSTARPSRYRKDGSHKSSAEMRADDVAAIAWRENLAASYVWHASQQTDSQKRAAERAKHYPMPRTNT